MRSMAGRLEQPSEADPSTSQYLVDVMSSAQKFQFWVLASLWVAVTLIFWTWWSSSSHIIGWTRFLVNSIVLVWTMVVPGYYLFFLGQMKKVNRDLPLPEGVRVAMVVTRAPSEPFWVIRNTLVAMLAQTYPHDTWLADEDPSPEIVNWCCENSVSISTRRGVQEYHRPTWPRRARCKEGNLAYFYDTVGYDKYDIVVQLDADQRPGKGYLEEMLRPFIDPRVGYVSAPSICDANAEQSWAARARLYAEGTLHGSVQAGYNAGWAPLCIGSHYAVRTSALREVGGLGPELAEDHSTTLMMNAHGWKGVHAFDAEAHGDGPLSFEDCMIQEFQWSRSLTTILLTMMPKYWRVLPTKLRLQFLLVQLWYPCFGLTMFVGFTLPVLALMTRTPWVSVSYIEFVLYKVPVILSALFTVLWVKRNRWLRPQNSRVITWEAMLFQLARWPWVVAGSITALLGAFGHRQFDFRITPKGEDGKRPLSTCVLVPYLAIAGISGLVVCLQPDASEAAGYYYLAILTNLMYSALLFVVVLKHNHEIGGVRQGRTVASPIRAQRRTP